MLSQVIWYGLIAGLFAGISFAQTLGSPTPLESIVTRMIRAHQENHSRVRAYTVRRDYQLLDRESQLKARLVAEIRVLPPDHKNYNIEMSSGGLGQKVLRDILSKEAGSSRKTRWREITPENYDFNLLGEEVLEGRRCYVLQLTPKHPESDLIQGKVWVDAMNYNIHRLQGKPAKSPSWWLHDLHILMDFAEVDGMWMHTFTHAVAKVRFGGEYTLVSRDLEYHTAQSLAQAGAAAGLWLGRLEPR